MAQASGRRLLLLNAGAALLLVGAGGGCAGGPPRSSPRRQADTNPEANVYVAPIPSSVHSVAVMPFQAETELIGASSSDLFVTELLRSGRYYLVERGQLSQVLSEAEVALSGISESDAMALGNMLGADGVIIGTVDEYGAIAQRGRSFPVVGLSVRLIDCESGRVMWSASLASMASDHRTPMSRHCRRVVADTVAALAAEWPAQRQIPRQTAREIDPDAPASRSRPVSRDAAPPPETPPAVPAFSLSDFGLRKVELQWDPPDASRLVYRIERAASPEGPFREVDTIRASRGSYTDRGTSRQPLADAAVYYYRLTAVSSSGLESDPSPVRESMTAPPPGPPENLRADVPAGRAVALRWNAGEGEGIARYIVERASPPEDTFEPVGEAVEPHFVEGGTPASPLEDAATYRYRVRAENRVAAVSEPSEPVEVTTRPPPGPVAQLAAIGDRPRYVPLSWKPSAETDVARYEIERAESADGPFKRIGAVEGRDNAGYEDRGDEAGRGWRASLTPLRDSTRYHYRVRAVNEVESASAWSKVVEAVTKPVPVAPAGAQAGEGDVGRITVTWQPNTEDDIAAYIVAASPAADGTFEQIERVAAPGGEPSLNYTEESLPPGITRYYRVRAVDADDLEGDWSDPVPGCTKPLPDAPRDLAYEWVNGEARLAWRPPPQEDVVRYRVLRRRFLRGSEKLDAVEEPESVLSEDTVGRRLRVVVTAIDADGLESEPSEVVDVRSP